MYLQVVIWIEIRQRCLARKGRYRNARWVPQLLDRGKQWLHKQTLVTGNSLWYVHHPFNHAHVPCIHDLEAFAPVGSSPHATVDQWVEVVHGAARAHTRVVSTSHDSTTHSNNATRSRRFNSACAARRRDDACGALTLPAKMVRYPCSCILVPRHVMLTGMPVLLANTSLPTLT